MIEYADKVLELVELAESLGYAQAHSEEREWERGELEEAHEKFRALWALHMGDTAIPAFAVPSSHAS